MHELDQGKVKVKDYAKGRDVDTKFVLKLS
jgi:hypothetical protein